MKPILKTLFASILFVSLALIVLTRQERTNDPVLNLNRGSDGSKTMLQTNAVENSNSSEKLIPFPKNSSASSKKENDITNKSTRSASAEENLFITLNDQKYNIETLTDNEAENIARWITKEQLQSIQNVVLTSEETPERRNAHLLFLIKMGTIGSQNLYQIFKSDIPQFQYQDNPHSGDSYKETTEQSLRITAIEALDQQAITDSASAVYIQKLNEEMSSSKNPNGSTMLGFLASISYSGIVSKQPGKLHRVLEAMINESSRL